MTTQIENYATEQLMRIATARGSPRHLLRHEAFRIIKNKDDTWTVRWALPDDSKHSSNKVISPSQQRIRELKQKGRDDTITSSELFELLRLSGFFG